MAGRYVEHNGIADAKAKEAYIKHTNMLYGIALREKLAEEKANKMKHQRKERRGVKRGEQ